MSQHVFKHDGSEWSVGWDAPMATYFAQRENAAGDVDDVAGATFGEHTRFASFVEAVSSQVTIPDEVQVQLAQDEPASTADARHQAQLQRGAWASSITDQAPDLDAFLKRQTAIDITEGIPVGPVARARAQRIATTPTPAHAAPAVTPIALTLDR